MRTAPVLMYHACGSRTNDEDPHGLFVPEAALRWQMEHVRSVGLAPLTLDDWLEGRRGVLLTVDDAWGSTTTIARVFADYDAPWVLYVPPALVGGRSDDFLPDTLPPEPMLTAGQLTELSSYGMELGVHGWDHADMHGMGQDELRLHTAQARDELERLTGVRARTFAYPRGVHDREARSAVERAGFDLAFAVGEDDGRFAMPRIDVNATEVQRSFALKLKPYWPIVKRVLEATPRVRRAGHRLVGSARSLG
ncbi:MAG: polysaccharide deacetylase family protein [Mycobacteriales bacterium]|nr:polysaccharide deacetylase family protein [Mycobacteriales bacterium]